FRVSAECDRTDQFSVRGVDDGRTVTVTVHRVHMFCRGIIEDGVRLFSDLHFRKRLQGFEVEDDDRIGFARSDETTTELRCDRNAMHARSVRYRSYRFEGVRVQNLHLRVVRYITA